MRPLCQWLQLYAFNGDGRSGRASLQDSVTASVEWVCVRCVNGYNFMVLTGTDAQIVRPYRTMYRFNAMLPFAGN